MGGAFDEGPQLVNLKDDQPRHWLAILYADLPFYTVKTPDARRQCSEVSLGKGDNFDFSV